MSTITYHLATLSDIDLLIDHRVTYFDDFIEAPDEQARQELRRGLREYYIRALPTGECIVWYATDNGELAAIGALIIQQGPGSYISPDGRYGYIMSMHTLEPYRRRGLAQEILDRLVQSGREAGIRFFELHASEMGEPLYIKSGFTKLDDPTYRKVFD